MTIAPDVTELNRMRSLLTETQRELAQVRQRLLRERDTHEAFRKRVADVAQQKAEENGWCDEVNDALRELGLEEFLPNLKKVVRFIVEVEVEGEHGWTEAEYYSDALDNFNRDDAELDSIEDA